MLELGAVMVKTVESGIFANLPSVSICFLILQIKSITGSRNEYWWNQCDLLLLNTKFCWMFIDIYGVCVCH